MTAMGIFDDIKGRIFGTPAASAAIPAASATPTPDAGVKAA